MSRESKPYFRKATQRWVCTIDGKRITLGPDKKAAHDKFHELMLNRNQVASELSTVYDLSQVYLDWCEQNRKRGTYLNQKRYLASFINSIGRRLKIGALKTHHITKWLESFDCTSTSKNDAVSIAQRMFNWAIEQQYISVSPIPKIVKPKRMRREVVYTPDQWKAIQKHATGSLPDFLNFLWLTGCRPKEARTVTANHVHDDLVIFAPDESKGETDARVIYLIPEAKAILKKQLKQNSTGTLFRNSRGVPWTKDAIKCRLTRISTKVGFRVIAYGARHSFATNALIRAVDTVSLSHLMGHKSTRMINNYAHLAHNLDFLKQQARNAAGLSGVSSGSQPSAAAETE